MQTNIVWLYHHFLVPLKLDRFNRCRYQLYHYDHKITAAIGMFYKFYKLKKKPICIFLLCIVFLNKGMIEEITSDNVLVAFRAHSSFLVVHVVQLALQTTTCTAEHLQQQIIQYNLLVIQHQHLSCYITEVVNLECP